MGKDDWYRNSDWSPAIEAAFYQRLQRARDKMQYLRLQAGHLTNTHPEVSLKLTDEYFARGTTYDQASVYLIRAEARVALGDIDAALREYDKAIAREREFPNCRTHAYLDFARLVVDAERTELFQRACDLLTERQDWAVFPVDRYRLLGTQALLFHALGRQTEAGVSARLALAAATEEHSGFSKHPELGLVANTKNRFGLRVRNIAETE